MISPKVSAILILISFIVSSHAIEIRNDFPTYWKGKFIKSNNILLYVTITTLEPGYCSIGGTSASELELRYHAMCSRRYEINDKPFKEFNEILCEIPEKQSVVTAEKIVMPPQWMFKISLIDNVSNKVNAPIVTFTMDRFFNYVVIQDKEQEVVFFAPPKIKEWLTKEFGKALFLN
jgi:hypothetical protein